MFCSVLSHVDLLLRILLKGDFALALLLTTRIRQMSRDRIHPRELLPIEALVGYKLKQQLATAAIHIFFVVLRKT